MPSVMQRVGTPNARHNLDIEYRKFLENVDTTLSKYNEVVRRKSVEEIYEEHLQPAFEEFNARQKRKDRRLDVKWECSTYLEYQRKLDKAAQESDNAIDKKGRPPIREIVWQFGNPEQGFGCANQPPERREKIKEMLLEVQTEAERRYPQFVWGDVVFHADEVTTDADDQEHGSLHLHASFVPLCHKNKQGTSVQVAFERCLHEMGFPTFESWKHDLDNIMEQVLERRGMERTLMENTEKHRDSTEFHRQQKIIRETKELEEKIVTLQQERQQIVQGIKGDAKLLEYRRRELAQIRSVLETTKADLNEAKEALNAELGAVEASQDLALQYQAEAEKSLRELSEARQMLDAVRQDTINLQDRKNLLEGHAKILKSQIEEMGDRWDKLQAEIRVFKQELPALQAQISDAESELALREAAIKQKDEEGKKRYTSAGWNEMISALRKEDKEKQKQELIEKFLKHPSVKPAWEKFQQMQGNQKSKDHTRDDGRW